MTRSNGTITYKGRSKKVKGAYVYIVRKEFPADSMTGKRQSKSVTVHGTHDDAEQALNDLETEHEKQTKGLCVDPTKTTFAEYADLWLKSQKSLKLAERTMGENAYVIRILSASDFGSIKLADIKKSTVENFLAQLQEERSITNVTLHKYFAKIRQILQAAVDDDILTRNYATRADIGAPEKPDRHALTRDEAYRLMRCIETAEAAEYEVLRGRAERENHWCDENGITYDDGKPRTALRGLHHLANLEGVRLMLNCALRLGEVMGLQWKHFDIEKGTLTICRALTNKGHEKDTKTHRDRTIMLDGNTRMALIRWRNIQRENLARLGITQDDTTPIICSDTGGAGNIGNFERWWRSWRAANGFEGVRLHELRHSAVSLMLAAGVDLKTVQDFGGWASPQILLDVYAHTYEDTKRAAAEKLGGLLNEPPAEPEQSEPPKFDVIKSA